MAIDFGEVSKPLKETGVLVEMTKVLLKDSKELLEESRKLIDESARAISKSVTTYEYAGLTKAQLALYVKKRCQEKSRC